MLKNLSAAIFTGVIASIAFEILKSIFIYLCNWICEKNCPFTVGGYWGAYHSQNAYSAFEFLILKQQGDRLKFRLYQKTGDDRFHFYRGVGYIRGNKVSLAYQEANKSISNLTGTFNLLVYNASEHGLELSGQYTEFSKNEKKCSSYPYHLRAFNPSIREIFLITISQKKYIKRFMDNERFQNVCKAKV